MSPDSHLKAFSGKIRESRRILARQLKLHEKEFVAQRDISAIYELSFMNIYIGFEEEITSLFISNMMLGNGTNGKKRSLLIPQSRSHAIKVLSGGKSSLQLLPIDNLIRISDIYLKDGVPFSYLSDSQKESIRRSQAIRNHIAHKSFHSKKKYIEKVLSSATLTKISYQPGFYLMSKFSRQITYFDHNVSELAGVMRFLCEET